MDVTVKPIPGHEHYFADVFGRIWSTYRGRWGNTYAPFHALKLWPDPDGYLTAKLWVPSASKVKGYHVHVLVAAAFLGPRPEGHHVCHYNGVRRSARRYGSALRERAFHGRPLASCSRRVCRT